MHEAAFEKRETGLVPADAGWFILNLGEIGWETHEGGGTWCVFEAPSARSRLLGSGVHVLAPGESPGYYHRENEQEGFLVLSGECVAIVEGQERPMAAWDYLHCPPGTAHIIVATGDRACAIMMVGTRSSDRQVQYTVDPTAARYGKSVAQATDSADVAYAERPPIVPARSPWPEIIAG